jgi:hypothetical protein
MPDVQWEQIGAATNGIVFHPLVEMPEPERTVNVPLLRKGLEHITAHPEEWDQQSWAVQTPCGTQFCLAGHVASMIGHEMRWDVSDCGCGDLSCCPAAASCVVSEDDAEATIGDVAGDALGLTYRQRDALFWGGNNLETMWELASHYTNGEIQPPENMT